MSNIPRRSRTFALNTFACVKYFTQIFQLYTLKFHKYEFRDSHVFITARLNEEIGKWKIYRAGKRIFSFLDISTGTSLARLHTRGTRVKIREAKTSRTRLLACRDVLGEIERKTTTKKQKNERKNRTRDSGSDGQKVTAEARIVFTKKKEKEKKRKTGKPKVGPLICAEEYVVIIRVTRRNGCVILL